MLSRGKRTINAFSWQKNDATAFGFKVQCQIQAFEVTGIDRIKHVKRYNFLVHVRNYLIVTPFLRYVYNLHFNNQQRKISP